jgi:predicted Zn-dependent protease
LVGLESIKAMAHSKLPHTPPDLFGQRQPRQASFRPLFQEKNMNQNFIDTVQGQLTELVEAGTLRGWSLKATASRSHQRLYASPGSALSCHQSRRVGGDAFSLSVYTPADDESQVGTAMLDLVPYRPIEQQLAEAVELARGSLNRNWTLAGIPAEAPQPVITCDPEIRDNPEGVIATIEQQFTAAMEAATACRLNSAELFVNYSRRTLTNSEGLTYETETSDLYLEAAMERAGTENDKEVHEYATSVAVADLDVTDFVARCALQVAVLGDSEEPATTDSAAILIAKDALAQMLDAVVQQLNCINEYTRLPFMKAGDPFGGGDGDALQLRLDPTLPSMALSCAYGIDSLPARPGVLIENNRVVGRIIGNRFGQYLGLEPNGLAGNIVVEPGSLNAETLKGTDYTEIIKFSSLLIDSNKLTWSSEIKLGRHIAADGTVTLVKGGVVSGNLKENFTDCLLSSTLASVSVPACGFSGAMGYRGPDALFITRGVSIAGQ